MAGVAQTKVIAFAIPADLSSAVHQRPLRFTRNTMCIRIDHGNPRLSLKVTPIKYTYFYQEARQARHEAFVRTFTLKNVRTYCSGNECNDRPRNLLILGIIHPACNREDD
jgi:hypothetical protein